MTPIQQTIATYMHGKSRPSTADMLAFVGMIETGEATYYDFMDVGGGKLAAAALKAKQKMDDARRVTA